jgi:hypothetical protein
LALKLKVINNYKMEGDFDLLIPIDFDLKSLGFRIPFFEWQGINYPQGPLEWRPSSEFYLKVVENYDFEYVTKALPIEYKNLKWQAITIINGLSLYISSLFEFPDNEEEDIFEESKFISVIQDIVRTQENWIVVFSRDSDGFKKVVKGTVEDIFVEIEVEAKQGGEGFLIYY